MNAISVVVQGFPGCFHDEAARKYWPERDVDIIASNTFEEQSRMLSADDGPDVAIMAIENSIAGSILQNYRLMREHHFWISGEVYLRIEHNLMCLDGQKIEDLNEVISHPMAINQCLKYFKRYPHIRLIETEDTAKSAMKVANQKLANIGAIASKTAADIYNLEIIASGIETSQVNYTRFFILEKNRSEFIDDEANKASIYLRVKDEAGCLLKVLQIIADYGMNMSKLQSFPVLGKVNEYYFYIDLEFDDKKDFFLLHKDIKPLTLELNTLGIYKKSRYDH